MSDYKKAVLAIYAALASIVLSLCLISQAHAEYEWKHFGADPFASSREEAMAKRERAFRALRLPDEVVSKLMIVTELSGEKARLNVGDRLDAMLSKGAVVHRDVVIAFEQPQRGIEFAAPAELWQVTLEGKIYTIYLPEICYNWSVVIIEAYQCVELSFNAPIGGKVRWGIGSTTGPLSPDECNAQRQGDAAWTSWYGECDICVPAIGYIRGILGDSALVPHKYLYQVTQTRQTLRFSTEIWSKLVYICLEDGGLVAGKKIEIHSCGVYQRPQDWDGQYHVEIPDSMWLWGEDCPK